MRKVPALYHRTKNVGVYPLGGDRYLIAVINGGTYGIPSGQNMEEFACWLHDDPEGARAKAAENARKCVEGAKRQVEWGADVIACRFGPATGGQLTAERIRIVRRSSESGPEGACIVSIPGSDRRKAP